MAQSTTFRSGSAICLNIKIATTLLRIPENSAGMVCPRLFKIAYSCAFHCWLPAQHSQNHPLRPIVSMNGQHACREIGTVSGLSPLLHDSVVLRDGLEN